MLFSTVETCFWMIEKNQTVKHWTFDIISPKNKTDPKWCHIFFPGRTWKYYTSYDTTYKEVQWDDSHLEENVSRCAKKRKASGELESLNEQPGTYDEFWGYTNRAEVKKKKRTKKGVRKRANSEWRRHDEFAAVSHQRARFNKALKPGAKPTKAKDVGKAKRKRSCVLVKSFRRQKQWAKRWI